MKIKQRIDVKGKGLEEFVIFENKTNINYWRQNKIGQKSWNFIYTQKHKLTAVKNKTLDLL